MYCRKCGALNPDDGNFCGRCGFRLKAYSAASRPPAADAGAGRGGTQAPANATVKPPPPPAVPPGHTRLAPPPAVRPYYAGFWKRFAAYFIDEIILNFLGVIVIMIVAGIVGIPMSMSGANEDAIAIFVMIYFGIFGFLLNWLYHTVLESSTRQATLGKMAISKSFSRTRGPWSTRSIISKCSPGILLSFQLRFPEHLRLRDLRRVPGSHRTA